MSTNAAMLVKKNMKTKNTLGEIFCVVPELYKFVDIGRLKFSPRIDTALMRGKYNIKVESLCDLLNLTLDELYSFHYIGKIALIEIIDNMGNYLEKHKPERPNEYVKDKESVLYAKDGEGKDIFDNQIILADNVKNIRKAKHQSQTDFANSCGITISILKSIENGTSNPKLSTLQGIANYADCTVSKLFEK